MNNLDFEYPYYVGVATEIQGTSKQNFKRLSFKDLETATAYYEDCIKNDIRKSIVTIELNKRMIVGGSLTHIGLTSIVIQ